MSQGPIAVCAPHSPTARGSTPETLTPPAAPTPTGATPTVIVFDWDDTLLASTWLAQNGLRLDYPATVPSHARAQLELLERSVVTLLTKAVKITREVIIITNAETGWVEMSAKKFMPAVVPLLRSVRVVSARSTYERHFPESPSSWKVQAFSQEIRRCYRSVGDEVPKNVLSFGDSVHERQAIHEVTRELPTSRTKSIKFVERPTVEQLKRQVDLVDSCLTDIVAHGGDLDLMLTIQLLYN